MNNEKVKSSFKYCEFLTRNHYENFPVASRLIPKEKRKYIYAVYAFARNADDYADEEGIGCKERRIDLIDNWEFNLKNCISGNPTNPIFIALGQTIHDLKLPVNLFTDLLKAFRKDVLINRYDKFDELISYCHYSANPVGRLILNIFDINDEKAMKYSDNICTALQLTNFWQDINSDLNKDRIYLPGEDLKEFEYTYDDLKVKRLNDNFRNLLRSEIKKTKDYYDEGRKLISYLKSKKTDSRLINELKLTILGGEKILNKLEKNDFDVFNKRPELTKIDFIKLIIRNLFYSFE